MSSNGDTGTSVPLTINLTLRIESRDDYWVGAIKGLGIVVRSDTYEGVTSRAVAALNFLLDGLKQDGVAPDEYLAEHGIECKPAIAAAEVQRTKSSRLFSLNGLQEIPLEGTLHVGG